MEKRRSHVRFGIRVAIDLSSPLIVVTCSRKGTLWIDDESRLRVALLRHRGHASACSRGRAPEAPLQHWKSVTSDAAFDSLPNMKKRLLTFLMICSASMGAERMTIQSWDAASGEIVYSTVRNSVDQRYWVEIGSSISGPWTNAGVCTLAGVAASVTCSVAVAGEMGYLRACTVTSAVPDGLVWVGSFQMGNHFEGTGEGNAGEIPVHAVTTDAFLMDACEVSEKLWDGVYHWATNTSVVFTNGSDVVTNNYAFAANGMAMASSESNHPIYAVNWYDCVKWCNARTAWFNYQYLTNALTPAYHTSSNFPSEYRTGQVDQLYVDPEATGYRLPTEAEWERAARGGLDGERFPWGRYINHSYANYRSTTNDIDNSTNTVSTYHPDYDRGGDDRLATNAYTCAVNDLPANGYGLHNMVGNVWEWCWDWRSNGYYAVSSDTDPTGPDTGTRRVIRGGCWRDDPDFCRVAFRGGNTPDTAHFIGFRTVLPFPSPVSEF
jgi:formylglycine-generating enzyme